MNEALLDLPEQERDYLARSALSILRSVEDASLESVLNEVATFRGDLEYGWEEAILSGMYFRLPSQVNDQIFCSERALLNYLLLETMGVSSQYAVVPNYLGTGMNHEVILVPNGDDVFVVDWQKAYRATVDHTTMHVSSGMKFDLAKTELIDAKDVVPRVYHSQNGDHFLDALCCGQVLYRRLTTNGELEARVSFDDSFNELMFDYHYSSSMAVPGFYFTIFFELQEDGTFKQDTDAGVVIQDEKGLRRISYLNSHLNTIAKLSELDQRAIYGFLLYDSITKGNPTEFFYSDHERETKLASMRNICEDPTNKHINYAKYTTKLFDLLYDQSSTHASRFLDFEIFMSSSFIECPSLADFRSLARTTISVENETIARFLHMGVALREIATVALATDALASQQKLCQELAHRTGKPYVAIPPSLFVDLLTDLGSNSIWQSTDS